MHSSGISLIKVYAPILHFIVFSMKLLIVGFYNNHLGFFPLLKDHASVIIIDGFIERTDFRAPTFGKLISL